MYDINGLWELVTCQFKLLNMSSPANDNIQMEEEYQASTKFFELPEGKNILVYVFFYSVHINHILLLN